MHNPDLPQSLQAGCSIESALLWGREQLSKSETAALDCKVLLSHVLQRDTTWLHTWSDKILSSQQLAQFAEFIRRRAGGEPVAYITGVQEFWSLPLQCNQYTLIPRPETELLVETVLQLDLPQNAVVLDLGTGTGAIALALASEKPDWQITAVDAVAEAVTLASENQRRLALDNVGFLQSDWFSGVVKQRFDLIVSNPPYVESDSPWLEHGDVQFEPASALTAGKDGLDDITHIIASSGEFLANGGYLLLEHGYQQGKAVRQLLTTHQFHHVHTLQDLARLDRVTVGRK